VRFFLDQDMPEEIALLLRHWGHAVTVLRDVLPITAPDAEAFAYARAHDLITVTCNRDDFLALAAENPEHPGLVILIRRRTRQAECGKMLSLLQRAGETGLRGNINFA
jgi:predicted nuclease of predicted toxin-antitoxin system